MLHVCRGAAYEYVDPTTGETYYSVSQVVAALLGVPREPGPPTPAMQRGTQLHRWWALALGAAVGVGPTPPPLPDAAPACHALRAWIAESVTDVLLVEEPRRCPTARLAGTVDAVLRLRDGRTVLIDLKTGQPALRDRIQLAAYSQLELPPVAAAGLLYLRPTGAVQLELVPPSERARHWSAVLAMLTLLEWRRALRLPEPSHLDGGTYVYPHQRSL